MNHKALHTYKPILPVDVEKPVEKGLRLLLLAYQRSLKEVAKEDWALRTGLEMEIDAVLFAAKYLQLDVDKEEGGEEAQEHVEGGSQEV